MDTMEVLTLMLVIFAILAYLDKRYDHDSDKKKQHPDTVQSLGCYFTKVFTLRAIGMKYSKYLSKQIVSQGT